MNRNQNWIVGKQFVGVRKKRVQFFIRVKIRARFCELKSSAWDKFLEEGSRTNTNNTKTKHAKRVGTFIRVRVPFASKELCQHEIARSTEVEEKISKQK